MPRPAGYTRSRIFIFTVLQTMASPLKTLPQHESCHHCSHRLVWIEGRRATGISCESLHALYHICRTTAGRCLKAMRSGHWDPAFCSRSGAGLMRCKYPCKFQVGAVAIAAALSSLYFNLVLEPPYCRVQTEFYQRHAS